VAQLMGGELTLTAEAVDLLRADPRGAPVLNHAGKNGSLPEQLRGSDVVSDNAVADLFELRVAAALSRLTKVGWKYEHPTGVGNSTVDFYVPGPPAWLIEVVSLRTSQNVKCATSQWTNGGGAEWSSTLLMSSLAAGQGKFEKEMLLAESKIIAKVSQDGKPWKFPPPNGTAFHAVVVDARGYLGDGGGSELDWIQMTGGAPFLPSGSPFQSIDGAPIKGIFEVDHPMAGAELARERLHFIGFVEETAFECGQVRYRSCFINNPMLLSTLTDISAAFATYPLRACHRLHCLCVPKQG